MFGQCWSLEGDSDALWRIYSSEKEGYYWKHQWKNSKLWKIKLNSGCYFQ